MNTFSELTPKEIWNYFYQITQVPRPSKKEEKIIQFLIEFGRKNNLVTKQDIAGNILISKPATAGKESLPTVILQCHVDMVCEKNSELNFNFETDSIQAYIDGDWVKAKGTTLGADDGIGVAAQLAVLNSKNIEHGPIECLFTVDEETGLTGAFELENGFMTGKYLLNLDSEDEGEVFIGCAGGIDSTISFDYQSESVPKNHTAYKIIVKGLKGGHSGDDINKGLGNSNKILNRLLWETSSLFDIKLSVFDGGNLRNAIPREAYAIILVPSTFGKEFVEYFNKYENEIKSEFSITEPDLIVKYEFTETPSNIIDEDTQYNLLNSLYACPHGVIAWSQHIQGLVETSTNLASIKFVNKKIIVTTSQRSSVNSAKKDIANMVESVFSLAGADVTHGTGYPGWTPNPNSKVLKIAIESYKKLFGVEPKVKAIHAGLECGLFLEKYPYLDMISFGPTL
ncbi:MAG: cytosol nonspecific dipeptidase, partial [Bacteroidetes bacterium GWA2_30_7]